MAEAIYRKYRPMTFGDVTGQAHVKRVVQNQITEELLSHAYLFSGPRGVGKTTIARLLAKTVNCEERKKTEKEPCNTCGNCKEMNAGRSLDIVEIDAASNTGVDNVRDNIVEAIRFSPNKSNYKVFIIDEVHMLSKAAFNALLKTLEEPPEYAIFVLATTELHKIPATIMSRCMRFNFERIERGAMIKRLGVIAKEEGVKIDDDVYAHIARLSEGCLRDAESLLNQLLSLGEKTVTKEVAGTVLPSVLTETVNEIMAGVVAADAGMMIGTLNTFAAEGGSVQLLMSELIEFVRGVALTQIGASAGDGLAGLEGDLKKSADGLEGGKVHRLLTLLVEASSARSYEPIPQLPLEIALLQYCEEFGVERIVPRKIASEPAPVAAPAPVEKIVQKPAEKEEIKPVVEMKVEVKVDEPEVEVKRNEGDVTAKEIANKWKRCLDTLTKVNIALPMALQNAVPTLIEGNVLTLVFTHEFHYDTINKRKNLDMIADAVNEVIQCDLKVAAAYEKPEDEKTVDTLVEAFGGSVVD